MVLDPWQFWDGGWFLKIAAFDYASLGRESGQMMDDNWLLISHRESCCILPIISTDYSLVSLRVFSFRADAYIRQVGAIIRGGFPIGSIIRIMDM